MKYHLGSVETVENCGENVTFLQLKTIKCNKISKDNNNKMLLENGNVDHKKQKMFLLF